MSYGNVKLGHIVATDLNGCIGKGNKLPWRVPSDLEHFKAATKGFVVVMGRKTFQSIGCKKLPDRLNIVVTSDKNFAKRHGGKGILFYHSLSLALQAAEHYTKERAKTMFWVIGSAELYAQTMHFADIVLQTRIALEVNGDRFYPKIDKALELKLETNPMVDEKSGLSYTIREYGVKNDK